MTTWIAGSIAAAGAGVYVNFASGTRAECVSAGLAGVGAFTIVKAIMQMVAP
jgi:hypothetical protein